MMGVLGRALIKGCLVFLPSLFEAQWPTLGLALLMAPVLVGVLICAWIAIRGAWREGWLAEIG